MAGGAPYDQQRHLRIREVAEALLAGPPALGAMHEQMLKAVFAGRGDPQLEDELVRRLWLRVS